MGASAWRVSVPWEADLNRALVRARANAYALIEAEQRARCAARSDAHLLAALDIDADDETTFAAWSSWLRSAPPETRFSIANWAEGGSGSVLDVDHVVEPAPPPKTPGKTPAGLLMLQPPKPELGPLRWATAAELIDWFGTEQPGPDTILEGEDLVFDSIPRGAAIAVPAYGSGEPQEVIIFGMTGD